jgi:diphthine-ammonia ligase
MELPLYRREITGQPIAQDSEYTTTTNDETEDLFFLIKEILVRKGS